MGTDTGREGKGEPTDPRRDAPAESGGREQSPRIALARLARDAALAVEGVASVGPHRRPGRDTRSDGERVDGVVCVAEPDGGYGVALYVGAEPVPLHALGERVRSAVASAAAGSGLAAELRSVDVVIEELVEPAGET